MDDIETTRNSVGGEKKLNSSLMLKKREVFSEVKGLVTDVFSRSSTAGQTQIEDFEFKN